MLTAVDRTKSRTAEKALELLVEFIKGPPHISVTDLARRTRMAPAIVQRLVNSLRASGFLEQEPRSRTYMLGLRALQLGATASNYNRLMVAAHPVMQEINKVTREAVLLAVVDKRTWRGAFIHMVDPLEPSNYRYRIQQQGCLHTSSTRKVLLAHLKADDIKQVIREVGLPKLTPNTITSTNVLLGELEQIRKQGYAVSRGEAVLGTTGVAAPIWGSDGAVVASLGVSAPDTRVTPGRLEDIRRIVVRGAAEISTSLRKMPLDAAGLTANE
ncbi:MAG TPA: IclR family transcriptional regulator [Thermoleophilia bacterium]|nr:IclR family transcriptional regulator [Thermoleophilia bacterium]